MARPRLLVERSDAPAPGLALVGHAGVAIAVAVVRRQLGVEHRGERGGMGSVRRLGNDAPADRLHRRPFVVGEERVRVRQDGHAGR